MRIITAGKDKGWCRCERCGCLLVPDMARYTSHLQVCDGTDSNTFTLSKAPFGTISLASYVASIADLPLPTKRQRDNFADYVSHSHSWYKHLPPYPPGVEFHFFIDSCAGREREHGTPQVTDRMQHGFHYSQIPTQVYRSAFGYLEYSVGRTNKIPLVVPVREGSDIARTDPMARISGKSALVHGLPEEIFAAGASRVTGAVHTLSAAAVWVWDEERRTGPVDWPQESGGRATLEKIFDRCRELREPGVELKYMERSTWAREHYPSSDDHLDFVDTVLYELLVPEQRRQRTEMIEAIDRMCDLIVRFRDTLTQ